MKNWNKEYFSIKTLPFIWKFLDLLYYFVKTVWALRILRRNPVVTLLQSFHLGTLKMFAAQFEMFVGKMITIPLQLHFPNHHHVRLQDVTTTCYYLEVLNVRIVQVVIYLITKTWTFNWHETFALFKPISYSFTLLSNVNIIKYTKIWSTGLYFQVRLLSKWKLSNIWYISFNHKTCCPVNPYAHKKLIYLLIISSPIKWNAVKILYRI